MKTSQIDLRDWLRQTGEPPKAFEYPYTRSYFSYLRWIANGAPPRSCLKFANAPMFDTWIFCHIPKTAGTAVVEALNKSDNLANLMVDVLGSWDPKERRRVMLKAMKSRRVIISGHIYLRYWNNIINWNGREKIFTVVREPKALQVSNINFIMGRIAAVLESANLNRRALEERVALWRERYGNEQFDVNPAGDFDAVASWMAMSDLSFSLTAEYAQSLMRSPPYLAIYSEVIQRFLSLGQESVDQSFDFVKQAGVNVVPMEQVGTFVRQTFGIEVSRGVNASQANVISVENAEPEILAHLVGHDSDFYQRLQGIAWRP